MAASIAEVRAARSFLRGRGINTKEIPPRKLANAAKELNKGFREVLQLLMDMRSGGQNQAGSRRTNICKEAE